MNIDSINDLNRRYLTCNASDKPILSKVELKDIDINPYRRMYQKNSNFKSKADFRTSSYVSLPPFALAAPSGIPHTLNPNKFGSTNELERKNRKYMDKLNKYHKVTDNSPLMQFDCDSSLNNKLVMGNKFNKKVYQ